MQYNLLQRLYDLQCELFISNYIDYQLFDKLEKEYLLKVKLFTICLN